MSALMRFITPPRLVFFAIPADFWRETVSLSSRAFCELQP
jgi:hypothetical protein